MLHAFWDRNSDCTRRLTPIGDPDGILFNETPSASESPFHIDSDNLSDIDLNINEIPPPKQSCEK